MNIEKLTMAIAARLVKFDWVVKDDCMEGLPKRIDQIDQLRQAVEDAVREMKE